MYASCILFFTLLKHILWPFFFQMVSWHSFYYALSWRYMLWPFFYRRWVGLVLNVYSAGDTECGLSCFSRWAGLVFNVHSAAADTGCSLNCLRGWVGLVFNVYSYGDKSVACLTEGGLACFSMCSLLVTRVWPILFQDVSWPGFKYVLFWWHRLWPVLFSWWVGLVFNVDSSGDTDCGLSCFSGWVGLVFNVHSSSDTDWQSCFRWWVGLVFIVLSFNNICLGALFLGGMLLFFWPWITLITHHFSLPFLVCKFLVFHCTVFKHFVFDISFLVCELLLPLSQFILLNISCTNFLCLVESMWSLLHVLWVLFGSFHFSIYMYSIIIFYQVINLHSISFKDVGQIWTPHKPILWYICVSFFRMYGIHSLAFLSTWYIFFKLRLYVFISWYTRMLIFCSLYVFNLFTDSRIVSLQPFSLLESVYFFTLSDKVTYLIYIVGKSTPFSIILESLVS